MLMDFLSDFARCVFFGWNHPKTPRLLSQAIARLNKSKPDRVFVEIYYHNWQDKVGGKQVFCKLRGTYDREGNDINYFIPLGASQKRMRAQRKKLDIKKYITTVAKRISLLKGITKPIKIKVVRWMEGTDELIRIIKEAVEIKHPEWVVLKNNNDDFGIITIVSCEQNEEEEECYE